MTADQNERCRREAPDLAGERQRFVGFEGVHARDAHERRPRAAKRTIQRGTVPEVDDRRAMPARFERRGDVLEPERFDSKERPQPEPIVAGHRPQEQDVHTRCSEAIIRSSGLSTLTKNRIAERGARIARRDTGAPNARFPARRGGATEHVGSM
jgi:hypothetical protein